jgi:tRNA nucleotidyltransferase (CCA-adding enzyme)
MIQRIKELENFKTITPAINGIIEGGGEPYLVGGPVRDLLLNKIPYDLDFVVFKMPGEKLEEILSDFGIIMPLVGKSFAVYKLRIDDIIYDFALPRVEKKTGVGHKNFEIMFDCNLTPEVEALRRDLTINAMSVNLKTGNLCDFYGGQQDLRFRVLKHVSPAFSEDPLRVIRVARFASVLDMEIHPTTTGLCQSLRNEAFSLSPERYWEEIRKWALTSVRPKKFWDCLRDLKWLSMFPEVDNLIGIQQDPKWHPEGDVYTHSTFATNMAKMIADRDNLIETDRIVLMLAALCHDLGKVTTTELCDDGRIRSLKHDKEGEQPIRSFLSKISCPNELIERIVILGRNHMIRREKSLTKRVITRLINRLEPENIYMLSRVVEADASARPPFVLVNPIECFIKAIEEFKIEADNGIKPILMGRHLLDLGYKPGPQMGMILKNAFEAQLDCLFEDINGAIEWVRGYDSKEGKENLCKDAV